MQAFVVVQDAEYEGAGAKIVDTKGAFGADIVLKVRVPDAVKEAGHFKSGGTLISYLQPAVNKTTMEKLQAKKLTAIGAHLAWHDRCCALELCWRACSTGAQITPELGTVFEQAYRGV